MSNKNNEEHYSYDILDTIIVFDMKPVNVELPQQKIFSKKGKYEKWCDLFSNKFLIIHKRQNFLNRQVHCQC